MGRTMECKLMAAYAEARSNIDAPTNRAKWKTM
jgi:hypothetical protein